MRSECMLFVYAGHLGGHYTTTKELTHEQTYCEQCGDSDWFIGMAKTEEEAEIMYKDYIDDNF